MDDLYIYGMTEVKIDKAEKLEYFKNKLQKVAYNMWSKALRSYDQLYIVESFDIKTVEDDLTPQYQLMSVV